MFEPTEKFRTVADQATGATLSVHSGPQIEFLDVRYCCPATGRISFDLICKDTKIGPNLIINASMIDWIFSQIGKTDRDTNTAIVGHIIDGLVALNRKWPQMIDPRMGSNYYEYLSKGREFSFSMPTDEELMQLMP